MPSTTRSPSCSSRSSSAPSRRSCLPLVASCLLLLLLLPQAHAFLLPCCKWAPTRPTTAAFLVRSSTDCAIRRRPSSLPSTAARRRRTIPSLLASRTPQEEEVEEEEPKGELAKLLASDPKETPLLGYLAFVTVSLLALGIGTYKSGGPLLGLGFSSDENFYWDSAPSYALLLVYPPLFFVFPEARSLLLKTIVGSFLVTLGIWAFPYEQIGWEPTNDHVLVTAAVPILAYLSFFSWRATKAYLEIAAEEEEERRARGE